MAMMLRNVIIAALLAAGAFADGAARAADDIPREMLALINAERAQAELPALAFDESLAEVARVHSSDMLSNHFFSHHSPATGDPADRVSAAKIAVLTQGENIAMGLSVEISHTNLMNSPSHRANILGEFTHCGIGAVEAPNGMLFITQLFATFPPAHDFPKLRTDIAEQINGRRTFEQKQPLAANAKLDALAENYANAMADAGKALSPQSLQDDIRGRGVSFKAAGIASIRAWNPIEICETDALSMLGRGQFGIGFARNTEHKALGYGIIWTVVVFTNE